MRRRVVGLLILCSCLNRNVAKPDPNGNAPAQPVITTIAGDGSAPDRIVSALRVRGTALDTVKAAALLAADGVTILADLAVNRAEATELELGVPASAAVEAAAGTNVVLQLTAPAGVARQTVQILRGEKGDKGDAGPSYGSAPVLGYQLCSGNATNNCVINSVYPALSTLGTVSFTAPAAGHYVIRLRGYCGGNEQDTNFVLSLRDPVETGSGLFIDFRTFHGVIPRGENAPTGSSVQVLAELTLYDVAQGATVSQNVVGALDVGASGTAEVRCRLWPTVGFFANKFSLTVTN